ncbi:hypothetical protein NQ036_04730 [Brevibacterium sp. 91QC2O2]|uniref:hypothetical protein n=1 Tax=Brevibacterium TaxID=1696 RepID=UPI00211C9D50|nr:MULTISPECIES: hypothetical protein [unclassified Brevibacterium]MCQ9367555.1 hypothetical protein [Brevibacterium sp. 91QC2O2]MCQ9386309.1 hypothetical protein [Brevibacterium sp. 68QC2CO]
MRILHSAEAGDWLTARAGGWATAGGVAGTGFEAYTRVLHPLTAYRFDPPLTEPEIPGPEPRIVETTTWRWAEMAKRNGLTMHPTVQWTALEQEVNCYADGWGAGQPDLGTPGFRCLAALLEHLAQETSTPDLLYGAVWDGFHGFFTPGELKFSISMRIRFRAMRLGLIPKRKRREAYARLFAEAGRTAGAAGQGGVARAAGPKMEWPGREFFLFTASAEELSEQPVPCPPDDPDPTGWDLPEWCTPLGGNTPQMLWSDDHQWVLASEIDWDSTIIAGPRPLIDRILTDERLEAYEVTADTSLTWESDTRNPNPHH